MSSILLKSCNLSKSLTKLHSLRFNSSKIHHERRLLKFTPEHVYSVISDVQSYNKFVPWCKKSDILRSTSSGFEAELTIGFGPFEEKYISNVTTINPISVKAISTQTTLLEYLRTDWTITPVITSNNTSNDKPKSCWVSFKIEFKFKSAVYSHISDVFFSDIVNKMVLAFENRCKAVTPS